jgi:hypothetical protein
MSTNPTLDLNFDRPGGVLDKMNQALVGIKSRGPVAMSKAILLIAMRSYQLCPKDTGALRKSLVVDVRTNVNGNIVGTVGYGADKFGPLKPGHNRPSEYAVYVHEIDKDYKESGTQWKYLETAFMEKATDAMRILGSELDLTKAFKYWNQSSYMKTEPLEDYSAWAD